MTTEAGTPQPHDEGAALQLACFAVAQRTFALDVAEVREVVRAVPVTPLPESPELIDGVVDLRGELIPVVDLGRALADAPLPADATDARIAVVECDGLLLGLRVEAAVEVLTLPRAALEAPSQLLTPEAHAGGRALVGLVRRAAAAPVLVLSLPRLVERVRSAPATAPRAAEEPA